MLQKLNMLRGNSLELRRLEPDPLNLLVNTDVGMQNIDEKDACRIQQASFLFERKVKT